MTNRDTPRDLYQTITDQVIAAMEAGAPAYAMPWHSTAARALPVNVLTKKTYRGVNILALWVAQQTRGFQMGTWGTYRQWQTCGAQVRRGEKASVIVFYKEREREIDDPETGETKSRTLFLARASSVFNACQVDGWTGAVRPVLTDATERIERAEHFVEATGATVMHRGDEAGYVASLDTILMPERPLFIGTQTSTPTEAYYSTLLHELTHWTSHESRVNRRLSPRFGDAAYAMEELIAEFGAAFLCAELGVTLAPRPDHAAYLDSWLKVLKSDKKALFTAASKASQAVDFLKHLQPEAQDEAA